MIKFLQKQNNNKNVSMIDNHLVLSLTDIDDPIIWRMSLEELGSAVFSIKNTKTKTALILKKSDKTTEEIAVFKNKEHAAEILSSISTILTQKETHKGASHKSTSTPKKEASKWLIALLLVVIIIALYYYLMTLMPQRSNDLTSSTTTSSTNTGGGTGQPIDADEFLRGL